MADSFAVQLSFKGNTAMITASVSTTVDELVEFAHTMLNIPTNVQLKLLLQGKRLEHDVLAFTAVPKKAPKILIMATEPSTVHDMNSKRSDPTIRGFDHEKQHDKRSKTDLFWGPNSAQHKQYKFCRFQACTWQSFGHRPTDGTPHDFEARNLLMRLATDPGVVAIMKERELVVGTLGEMDPIDDRLMQQKKQESGACLLGYNTNGGSRIDIKLRTDDLKGFRPYSQLVATLIHELSHNWVGEHNLLFWTNYAQMRAEYLYTHSRNSVQLIQGKTTLQLAGLHAMDSIDDVVAFIVHELKHEMLQHGLHPNMIVSAIREGCQELERTNAGHKLASSLKAEVGNPREMALQAAERRRAAATAKDDQNKNRREVGEKRK